jgi:hypothetical protein
VSQYATIGNSYQGEFHENAQITDIRSGGRTRFVVINGRGVGAAGNKGRC